MKKSITPFILLAVSMLLAACDTTPPPVSTLMQQIAQASQDRSKDELRPCYAKGGVTAQQIEQHLGSWDTYFDKGQNWTYTGITYVSLADAPNSKSLLPDMIAMAQGNTSGGIKFGPNIKVVGFILISFKQPDGSQAGATEDVGIASDGTAKLALVESK